MSEALLIYSSAMSPGAIHNLEAHTHTQHTQSNVNGRKRARESVDSDDHLLSKVKRTKFAIEIPPPKIKSLPPRKRSGVIKSNANPDLTSANSVQQLQIASSADVRTAHPPTQKSPTQKSPTQKQPTQKHQPQPTKHRNKVANGIRHELDRLQDRQQVTKSDIKDERRKLRSQGTKFKSELSAYFPEYDEIIGNVPKEERRFYNEIGYSNRSLLPYPDFLDADTPIIIIDSSKIKQPRMTKKERERQEDEYLDRVKDRADPHYGDYPVKKYPSSLFSNLQGKHEVSFWSRTAVTCDEDPLSEQHFKTLHKRPERQEKAVRNADKSRAQHERDSVIRLMEGLQGPDWLKTLGISGITESRKKEFGSARQYFIKGCETILEKFRIWKDDDKQRKLMKDRAIAEALARAKAESTVKAESKEGEESEDDFESIGDQSNGDPPDLSDIDASAARQLHDEAIASSAPRPGAGPNSIFGPLLAAAPTVEREFTSFFPKPYLRDAALGKYRRSGRSVIAWGHPVPDLPEELEFGLPDEFFLMRQNSGSPARDYRINGGRKTRD
ncbi:hypothetical protein SBOR_8286 [Sclerotinia borealis F-4128]|uniref:Something about silencing protein 4 domain-containing protein n=1 Tax=Sclerotinia borealis (strain F-4128) TaxID=1432307 RepID=W9C9Z1_SCLBF|nr:hypothetical protein SBOR_8286 [Sclerotinia borealis F-4128]